MLLVIFGARASFDSVPHRPPSVSQSWDDARPPLANQLFQDRELFVDAMKRFPQCMALVPPLRKPGVDVEQELATLQEQAKTFPLCPNARPLTYRGWTISGCTLASMSGAIMTVAQHRDQPDGQSGRRLIQACVTGKGPADYVFTRSNGKPARRFSDMWATVTAEAGVPELLFHDLRRTAARDMDRRGISQHVAMKITGHKTASMYKRYRIVDEADLRDATART
jgi:integrase-like protein